MISRWKRLHQSLLGLVMLSAFPAILCAQELATQDGLYLRFRGLTGEMLSMLDRTEALPLKVATESYETFSITDYAKPERSGRIPIGIEQASQDSLSITGGSESLQVALSCDVKALPSYMVFSLRLTDRSGEDRAVTLRFQMPVKAEGWSWWNDVATPRTMQAGQRYVRYGEEERGRFPLWWYPIGAISDGSGHGLAFAVPMDPPTLARVGYDGNFFIEFDLGLSEATKKFPSRADVTFYLYRFDGEWGLRSALKKYYDLFPQYFTKRVTREGVWLARMPTQAVDRPEDFGITFHQVSSVKTNSLAVDNGMGLYTFLYDEPGRVGIMLPFDEADAGRPPETEDFEQDVPAGRLGSRPSPAYVMKKVEEFAGDPSSPQYMAAQATLALASITPRGSYDITIVPRPGVGWRCLFSAATDPEIVIPGKNETRLDNWKQTQLARMLSLYEGRYDGQYIDSSEWLADTLNCRRDHFAYADYPLGFDRGTGKPGINTGVGRFEYYKAVSEELRKAGKLMMANGTPIRFGFYVSLLDVAGSETWHDGRAAPRGFGEEAPDGRPRAASARDWRNVSGMYCRRALLYQKPFCFLLKLMSPDEMNAFGMERLQVFMDWCLFFAVYPGIGEGIYEDPEPYRDLYRKYMPVAKALGTAGWEPVTHARTDSEALRVERYGYWSQGTLYFAVRNFTDQEAGGTLTIDLEALAVGKGSSPRDAFAGEVLESTTSQGRMSVPVKLPPARTAVIHVGLN